MTRIAAFHMAAIQKRHLVVLAGFHRSR
jgi:hypothetical protein